MPRTALTSIILLLAAVSVPPALADTELVSPGSVWKYLDDGSDQDTLWTEIDFDDGNWSSGPAQLGYGDGDETTTVGYGPDPDLKYPTTYFRHAFTFDDAAAYVAVELKLQRDDGAVVHLNGEEIHRSNMPAGEVTYQTFAASTTGGDAEGHFHPVLLDPGLFAAGDNLLSVEVHQRSHTSSDISFDLELTALTELAHPFRKTPWLIYRGENTEMKVVWELLWDEPATLAWGEDTTYALGSVQTAEYGSRHQHAHTITGLTPAALYRYRVVAGADTLAGSFRAAPPDDATAIKFMAYGDTRTYPAVHDEVAAAMVETYRQDAAYRSLVLSMGDLVGNGDSEADWQVQFFDPLRTNIRELLAHLPYQACLGNHEASGGLFAAYFPYPFVADRYWSFDYGPAHFAVVDQYVDYGPGSPQLAWLDADLAATDRPWKFIVLHEPGWSAGGGHENSEEVQTDIWPLCLVHDVAIVFGGHNQYYARAELNGVQHITTGGGGAPTYTPDPGYPFVVATSATHHFCKVAIDGDLLTLAVTTPEGEVVDTFTRPVPTAVSRSGDAVPAPVLLPAHPNPFNASTAFAFTLPADGKAALDVFDLDGGKVRTLLSGNLPAGDHDISWDGRADDSRAVGSGIYIYRLRAAGRVLSGRVMLVK